MKQINLILAILGGFVGTLVMTTLLYLAPLMGAPKFDIAAILGSVFGHGVPAAMTGLWWVGMVWHFLNGTVIFSLIYSWFVYGWLTGENFVRGTIWGMILWIAMEVVFMPITGHGMFDRHAASSAKLAVVAFVMHAVYGAVFGAMAGEQAKHSHHVVPHPA
jgi:hypothetical protein